MHKLRTKKITTTTTNGEGNFSSVFIIESYQLCTSTDGPTYQNVYNQMQISTIQTPSVICEKKNYNPKISAMGIQFKVGSFFLISNSFIQIKCVVCTYLWIIVRMCYDDTRRMISCFMLTRLSKKCSL